MKLQTKIEHCLEKYPETRNSDIKLTNSIWFEFHNNKIKRDADGDLVVKLKDLYDLPREDHIKRIRAKIQNSKSNPRFLPTDIKILKGRKILEKYWHLSMSPSNPSRG